MVGTGVAAKFGVLIKGAEVFDKMKNITMIIFDKTGTLTHGLHQVKNVIDVCKKFKYDLPEN
jgi:P-type E1-E2 ATPase